jgi:hypothetical protein
MQRLDLGKKLFLWRALSALGISIIANVIDFIGGPVLTIPQCQSTKGKSFGEG